MTVPSLFLAVFAGAWLARSWMSRWSSSVENPIILRLGGRRRVQQVDALQLLLVTRVVTACFAAIALLAVTVAYREELPLVQWGFMTMLLYVLLIGCCGPWLWQQSR